MWQGVNWRSKEALDCNGGLDPLQQNFNDGINVGPLEAMFTKARLSALVRTGHCQYEQRGIVDP